MVPNLTILCCCISLILSLFLPPIIGVLFARKHKGEKLMVAWLLGAAGFFVTQLLIRVPILSWLQTQSWFVTFSQNHLFLYAFTLAFSAGLFELTGRFGVAKLMKNLNFRRSLAAGLGHGGIEAMILVGITYINNLAYIAMINAGIFDSTLAEAAAMGVDVSQLYLIRDSLISTNPVLFLLGGFERVLAMICHAGMTMVVCYGLRRGKPLQGALISLGIHTLIDLTAGINLLAGNALSQTAAYVMIYALLLAAAIISISIIRKIRRRWPETEVSHDF